MTGLRFFKMTGSGNDFVVVDARGGGPACLSDPEWVRRVCAPATGVGSDGLVVMEHAVGADFRMIYLNRDGSRAEMCGNAALCAARLAAELGAGPPPGMRILTDSGMVAARLRDGVPEIDLAPVRVVVADAPVTPRGGGERRIGYAEVGVPHFVVLCEDVDGIDLSVRGPELRRHPWTAAGANVNFVSASARAPADAAATGWRYRTFERGVERETLACGTGAVATAVLLNAWGSSAPSVLMLARSGRCLTVELQRAGDAWRPTLRGEARLVFVGELREL